MFNCGNRIFCTVFFFYSIDVTTVMQLKVKFMHAHNSIGDALVCVCTRQSGARLDGQRWKRWLHRRVTFGVSSGGTTGIYASAITPITVAICHVGPVSRHLHPKHPQTRDEFSVVVASCITLYLLYVTLYAECFRKRSELLTFRL